MNKRMRSAYVCGGVMGVLIFACFTSGIGLCWVGGTQVAGFKPKMHYASCRLYFGACVEVCNTPCDCRFELWYNATYTAGSEFGVCLFHVDSHRYRDVHKCQSDYERWRTLHGPCYVYVGGICQNANEVDNSEALSGFYIFVGVMLLLIAFCICWSCRYPPVTLDLEVPLN
jgi:hypothetical protein